MVSKPCSLPHQHELPGPEIRITFSDGTYYKVIVSEGEAALAMAQVAASLGIKPRIYNSLGERLGVGTDNNN